MTSTGTVSTTSLGGANPDSMTFPMKMVDKTETLTYMRAVRLLQSTMIPLKRPALTEIAEDGYVPMNPCVLPNKDGRTYLVVVRCTNYKMCACGYYGTRTNKVGHIDTRNVMYVMDEETIYLEKEITDKTGEPFPCRDVNDPRLVDGYEDMRIFWKGDELHYSAGSTCYHPPNLPNIVMGKIDTTTYDIVTRTHMYLDPMRCEKNWLPLVLGDSVYVVYNPFPLVMFELVNYPARDMALVVEKDMTKPDIRVRGGARPIRVGDYYLIVAHETIMIQGRRNYVHRFVRYDSSFSNDGDISDPFFFFHQGIEFCTGMCLTHDSNDLLITLGVEDADAALVRVPVSYVMNTFFS